MSFPLLSNFSSYILTFLHLIHPITLTYKTMRITYQNISFQILIYCQIFRPISIDMRINLKIYANITPSTIEYLPICSNKSDSLNITKTNHTLVIIIIPYLLPNKQQKLPLIELHFLIVFNPNKSIRNIR